MGVGGGGSGTGLMGIGSRRTVVLRLASEEGMGRDSDLVLVKIPGASFGVPGRVRLAWRELGLPTGVP